MTGSKHKTKIPQLKLTKIKSTATQLTHKWCRKLFLDTNFTKLTQAIVCQHYSAWLCILASPLTCVILNKSLNLSVPVPYLQNGNNNGAYFRDRKNWSCSVVSDSLWPHGLLPGSSIHGIFQARVLEWLPFPSPGDLPNPGTEPGSPTLHEDALLSETPGKWPTSEGGCKLLTMCLVHIRPGD